MSDLKSKNNPPGHVVFVGAILLLIPVVIFCMVMSVFVWGK